MIPIEERRRRLVDGEYDDIGTCAWGRFADRWHQVIHISDLARFPCQGVTLPMSVVELVDYRSHAPGGFRVCRNPHCRKPIDP